MIPSTGAPQREDDPPSMDRDSRSHHGTPHPPPVPPPVRDPSVGRPPSLLHHLDDPQTGLCGAPAGLRDPPTLHATAIPTSTSRTPKMGHSSLVAPRCPAAPASLIRHVESQGR